MNELEERWRDLGEFIREQRHVGQLSLRKLSEMAGISNPYLSQIERGMRKPSAEILRQIAGALHISAETLYVRAGILDERDGEADLVAEIRRDPFIDEEQKKTLVHIYESFRSDRAMRSAAELHGEAVGNLAVAPAPVQAADDKEHVVSEDAASEDVVREDIVSEDIVSEHLVSDSTAGDDVVSDEIVTTVEASGSGEREAAGSTEDGDSPDHPAEDTSEASRLLTDA